MIPIAHLDKAIVLAALYNAARPQGMGFLHYDPKPMTEDEAREYLKKTTYFDYLKGRVMKIDLSKDVLEERLYDRDNGVGAAERAIHAAATSQSVDSTAIQAAHADGTSKAIEEAKHLLGQKTKITYKDGYTELHLGIDDDLKQVLSSAIEKASKE